MADRRIFIADGHHRYETALNYKKERDALAAGPSGGGTATSGGGAGDLEGGAGEPGNGAAAAGPCCACPDGCACRPFAAGPPHHYVMMTLVNMYDPGLVVLPTHRLVKNVAGLDRGRLVEQLKENFTVEEYPLAPDRSNFKDFLKLLGERGGPRPGAARRHAFGLYSGGGRLHLLSLADETALARLMPEDRSPAWRGLDVAVLHTLIIEKHLGIGGELRAKAEHITYTREEEGALAAVDAGEYQLAFFLNPTLVEEVTAVAAGGEKMPQKSTYFYPKLITGLVVNRL
ncbi:MAG: DUF1015 domain-containing protein [Peptococcaceae bacterium]|nr:DUF1015 domain-containing protein [Peptococcaceae bacterium]